MCEDKMRQWCNEFNGGCTQMFMMNRGILKGSPSVKTIDTIEQVNAVV